MDKRIKNKMIMKKEKGNNHLKTVLTRFIYENVGIGSVVLMQPKVFMTWYEDFFICMILYAKGASCYQYYQGTEDFFFKCITKEVADAAQ